MNYSSKFTIISPKVFDVIVSASTQPSQILETIVLIHTKQSLCQSNIDEEIGLGLVCKFLLIFQNQSKKYCEMLQNEKSLTTFTSIQSLDIIAESTKKITGLFVEIV